jgi:hypothetical protein
VNCCFPPGAILALSAPGSNICRHARPDKTTRQHALGSTHPRVRNGVYSQEYCSAARSGNQWADRPAGYIAQQGNPLHIEGANRQGGGRNSLLCVRTAGLLSGQPGIIRTDRRRRHRQERATGGRCWPRPGGLLYAARLTRRRSLLTRQGGRDSVSATTFATPATCRRSLVYSAMYARWRCCLAVHGSNTLCRALVSGL